MRRFKVLSVILAFLLAFSVMPTAFASADDAIFDVIGLNLNIEEGQAITRFDLAKMAISLGGLEVEKSGENWTVRRWQAVSVADWEPDMELELWDGGMPEGIE